MPRTFGQTTLITGIQTGFLAIRTNLDPITTRRIITEETISFREADIKDLVMEAVSQIILGLKETFTINLVDLEIIMVETNQTAGTTTITTISSMVAVVEAIMVVVTTTMVVIVAVDTMISTETMVVEGVNLISRTLGLVLIEETIFRTITIVITVVGLMVVGRGVPTTPCRTHSAMMTGRSGSEMITSTGDSDLMVVKNQ